MNFIFAVYSIFMRQVIMDQISFKYRVTENAEVL
jgi:hypothetical protein